MYVNTVKNVHSDFSVPVSNLNMQLAECYDKKCVATFEAEFTFFECVALIQGLHTFLFYQILGGFFMKKKFIVVFLVTVSFVVGSFTGVFADYTPTNDAYTLVNYLNGKVIIAGYKGNKLVALEINDYSEDFKPVVLDGDIDKIKVMVWDNNAKMKPVTTAEEISYTDFK